MRRAKQKLKIIVEKHPDGYVAYPLGLMGVVVGEGESYEETLADVQSAIRFHIETFGQETFEDKEKESAEPPPAPTHPLLGLKPYPVGHARECTFRREDLYGDDSR